MTSPVDPLEPEPQTLERIELAFPDLVGNFEVHERDLCFDGRSIADWLAYSQGRVLLISVVDGRGDGAVLRALDGLAFARSQAEMLGLSIPGLTTDTVRTRVVLVALDGFSSLQLERLEGLRGDDLWLLRKRELRTKRGSHTRLEPLEVGDGRARRRTVDLPEWAVREPFRGFLARIAPDRLELALTLVDRARRIDPRLSWSADEGGLACALDAARLARLLWTDGHLELEFDQESPRRSIRGPETVDAAVEALLGAYLERLDGTTPRARRQSAPPAGAVPQPVFRHDAASSRPGFDAAELDDLGELDELDEEIEEELDDMDADGEELGSHELRPMPPGPLLTAEEIEAFHD